QVPKFLRVAGSPTVVILHGSKVRTFPASLVSGPPRFAGTLLIEVYRQSRLLGQHALSIRLASRFRGSRPAMMAQATWFQGLKLTDPTSWPDRHGPWSAWSQVVKRVQFA